MNQIKIIPILESLRVLDISDEEYFSSEYRKYISNSSLSLINPKQGGSPQKYKEGLQPRYSDSLHFGTAVHCLVLQPDDYEIVYEVNRPTAKAGFMADELYEEWLSLGRVTEDSILKASDKIDYYRGKMDSRKQAALLDKIIPYFVERKEFELKNPITSKKPIFLDVKSRDKVTKCVASVTSNADIRSLLYPEGLLSNPTPKNEQCMLLDVKAVYSDGEEKILSLKAKLDNYYYDEESNILVLNDLKTTGHDVNDFVNSFYKFHYFRQFGFYAWLLYLDYKNYDIAGMKANVIISSTIPPFNSGIFKVYNTHIRRGLNEFQELLKRVAYHERYGYDIEPPEL